MPESLSPSGSACGSGPDADLWVRAEAGDRDAIDLLAEQAGEREDTDALRRLAAAGSRDAVDVLVEIAAGRGDRDELRRLAAAGSTDAADVLAELDGSEGD